MRRRTVRSGTRPPAARTHTVNVIREVVTRYAVDGVHLDYIRFPSPDFDYSRAAIAAFRATVAPTLPAAMRARLDREAQRDPTIWARANETAWAAFRRDRLTALVTAIRAAVREARPHAIVSAAVYPDPVQARSAKLQDWPAWTHQGWLDAVAPMIYTTDAAAFARSVTLATSATDAPVWAGIGAYRLPAPRTVENVRAARRLGASGIVLFSYDSLAAPSAPTRDYFTILRPVLLESDSTVAGDR